jgi:hypothetical protein
MPSIIEERSADYACPFNEFKPCLGAKCMAFVWSGRPVDRCETDNLVETADGARPIGAPKTPDGEGWITDGEPFSKGYHRSEKDKLPKATGQRWVRRRERLMGACSRVNGADYFDCDAGIPF